MNISQQGNWTNKLWYNYMAEYCVYFMIFQKKLIAWENAHSFLSGKVRCKTLYLLGNYIQTKITGRQSPYMNNYFRI